MKVLVIGGLPRSLTHFRGPLIKAMLARGHAVSASANGPDPETERGLAELGVDYHPVRLDRAGVNPVADVVTLCDLTRLVRLVKPDVVFSYTIKPVIYGTLAARLCGV
ncbi:MAG: glycosyltransferase, partial [Patescibacteria group bacterium]|nr:glycosyltransferase [Patescibacteria group bacterium]